jgi:hypothetical protein
VKHRPLTSGNWAATPGICETPFLEHRLQFGSVRCCSPPPGRVLGFALTLVLPETSRVSLEDIGTAAGNSLNETAIDTGATDTPRLPMADPAPVPLPVADQASAGLRVISWTLT